jgi:hypothetical protein
MIDKDKDCAIENLRILKTGYGTTSRQRSDIYNEIISLGLKVNELRQELGDKEFENLLKVLNKVDLKRINLEKLA